MADEQVTEIRIVGENGAGDQVFKGTYQEIAQKLADAQRHGTAKIREQEEQLRERDALLAQQQQQTQQPAKEGEFDRQKYFALLYENPQAAQEYSLNMLLGRNVREFVAEYDQVKQGAQIGMQQAINSAFVQRHPELLQVTPENDAQNAKTISDILTKRGWSYNLDNLDAAYAVARQGNQLKLPEAMTATFTETNTIQLPAAPITTGKPASQTTSAEQAESDFLRTAPLDKVRDFLEQKSKGQQIFAPTTV